MYHIKILSLAVIVLLLSGSSFPLFDFVKPVLAQTPSLPTVANAVVSEQQASLSLPTGASTYIYGYTAGGLYSSGLFQTGQYASVMDADGQNVAALAVTNSNTDSFSTSAQYYAIGGIAVSGYSSLSDSYGSNNSPGATSASDKFTITNNNSLVVVVASGGDEQTLTVSGLSGFTTDASYPGSPDNALVIGHSYLNSGTYTVTENTLQSAAGQDPNNAGDLIGVFVFSPSSESAPATLSDTFTSDSSLNTNLWEINGPVGNTVFTNIGSPPASIITPTISFQNGLDMSGVSGTYQAASIQSVQSFSTPFTLTTTVEGTVANGNPFVLGISNQAGTETGYITGNINSANGGYYAIKWGSGTSLGTTTIVSNPSTNIFYTLTISVDSTGTGTFTVSSNGNQLGQVTEQVGTGSFYILLGQFEGLPYTIGPNNAIWQSVSLSSSGSSGGLGGSSTVSSINVSASPTTIISNNGQSTITATVLDQNDQPMPNVPLTLLSTAGSLIQQSFTTDSQGQVTAILSSLGTISSPITVTITGQVNGVKGTTQVTIVPAPTLKILSYSVSPLNIDYFESSNPTNSPYTICGSGNLQSCASSAYPVLEEGVQAPSVDSSPSQFTISVTVALTGASSLSRPMLIATSSQPTNDVSGQSLLGNNAYMGTTGTDGMFCEPDSSDPSTISSNTDVTLIYDCTLFPWTYATQLSQIGPVIDAFIRSTPLVGGIYADLLVQNYFIPQVNYTMSLIPPNNVNFNIDTTSMTTNSFLGNPQSIQVSAVAPLNKIDTMNQYVQHRIDEIQGQAVDDGVEIALTSGCVVGALPTAGLACVPAALSIAANAVIGAVTDTDYQKEIADPSLNYTQLVQVQNPPELISSLQNTTAGTSLFYLSLYNNYLNASVQSNIRAYGASINNSTYYAELQNTRAEQYAQDASIYYNDFNQLLNQTMLQLNNTIPVNQTLFEEGQEYIKQNGLPPTVMTILNTLNLTSYVNETQLETAPYTPVNFANVSMSSNFASNLVNDDKLYFSDLNEASSQHGPTLNIISPSDNSFSNHNVINILGTTEDTSGIEKVTVSIDGNQSSPAKLNFGAYSNSTVTWSYATPPLADDSHVIIANSTSNAGISSLASVLVTVDTVPPEAYVQFDPTTKDVILYGIDSLSGIPNNPISPTSVVPAKWDDDDNKFRHDNDTGDAQIRTYDIVDRAGNTLALVEKVRTYESRPTLLGPGEHEPELPGPVSNEEKISILSLQYNNGAVISVLPNEAKFEWSADKNGVIDEINQHVIIGQGNNQQDVDSMYSTKDGITVIYVNNQPAQGNNQQDVDSKYSLNDGKTSHDNKNQSWHVTKITDPGLVLLHISTNQGKLLVNGY